jgi:DNA-directed RNA polymerase alpha subunit
MSFSITITGDTLQDVYQKMQAMVGVLDGSGLVKPLSNEAPADLTLDGLNLSVRARNVLLMAEVKTLEQLMTRSTQDLRRLPNVGGRTIDEIQDALAAVGLRLRRKGD